MYLLSLPYLVVMFFVLWQIIFGYNYYLVQYYIFM